MADVYVAPSREGKKSLTVWQDAAFINEVKIAAIRAGQTMQEYVAQALQERMDRDSARQDEGQ